MTKDRMNGYGPVPVFSVRGQWKAATSKRTMPATGYDGPWETWDFDKAVPFADGIRIYQDGRVTGAGIDETAIRSELLKQPGADHVMGLSHIFDHFQEGYYVPSLYWRAVQRRGNPAFCYRMAQQEAARGETRLLKDDLRAYFKKLMPALVAEKMREVERAA